MDSKFIITLAVGLALQAAAVVDDARDFMHRNRNAMKKLAD